MRSLAFALLAIVMVVRAGNGAAYDFQVIVEGTVVDRTPNPPGCVTGIDGDEATRQLFTVTSELAFQWRSGRVRSSGST